MCVTCLLDGDGVIFPITYDLVIFPITCDLASEVVLQFAVVSAFESCEEGMLEAGGGIQTRTRAEEVVDVG